MRRTSIAFALSTLLLASICSAQQTASTSQHTAPKAGNPANTTTLVGGPDTVVNCVQAQVGRSAMFTAATVSSVILCNSGIYEAQPYGTGAIGILNPHPVSALDVNGNINTSTTYQIGGVSVLSTPGSSNVFLGQQAGSNNTTGLYNNFVGVIAGLYNTTGFGNNFIGPEAGYSNTTGCCNNFVGPTAGYYNTTGNFNNFVGQAGFSNTTGTYNNFVGYYAGLNNTTGTDNNFIGTGAGKFTTTGSFNNFLGDGAGNYNNTGSYDIYISNLGPVSGAESNTIRIGDANQTAAY